MPEIVDCRSYLRISLEQTNTIVFLFASRICICMIYSIYGHARYIYSIAIQTGTYISSMAYDTRHLPHPEPPGLLL